MPGVSWADRPPVCGFEHDGRRCSLRGAHMCRRRAERVLAFFAELLVHTRGDWTRRPFIPATWQRKRVLDPLFGRVIWDEARGRYVRQYRTLYLYTPRKNGKSELVAGIVLYLLASEGEEGGEIYGLALDKDQAGHVYRAAARMVELGPPVLRQRLEVVRSTNRILDRKTASFFAVAAGDALGALGANPSAAYIDELLTQPDRELYDALRTGFGARAQPLLMMATTAEGQAAGFAATERAFSMRVLADPELDPTRLVVAYQAPEGCDWTDERVWFQANPALGDFLELRALRDDFRQALNNPPAERAFRQYRLNLPVAAAGRAILIDAWDQGAEPRFGDAQLGNEAAYGGLDLAQRHDLATVCWMFPLEDGRQRALWRIWTPHANLAQLDRRTGGQASVWARQGWLVVTGGEVIDYEAVKEQIQRDRALFDVREIAYDPWGMTQLVQELMDAGLQMVEMRQGWATMAGPTSELLRLIKQGRLLHSANPIVRWCAQSAVTRSDTAGNLKWDKERSADKIDPIVAATMALARAQAHKAPKRSAYEERGMVIG